MEDLVGFVDSSPSFPSSDFVLDLPSASKYALKQIVGLFSARFEFWDGRVGAIGDGGVPDRVGMGTPFFISYGFFVQERVEDALTGAPTSD